MKQGDGRATRWVFLWLNKAHPDKGGWWATWESFSMDSWEDFRDGAKRFLSDRSTLSTKTLDCADWESVYDWFKKFTKGE